MTLYCSTGVWRRYIGWLEWMRWVYFMNHGLISIHSKFLFTFLTFFFPCWHDQTCYNGSGTLFYSELFLIFQGDKMYGNYSFSICNITVNICISYWKYYSKSNQKLQYIFSSFKIAFLKNWQKRNEKKSWPYYRLQLLFLICKGKNGFQKL